MSLQRCATCGKEFERDFADSSSSLNCPACVQQLAKSTRASLPPLADTLSLASFSVTVVLIAASVLLFAIMVLRGVSAEHHDGEQQHARSDEYDGNGE